MFDLDLKEAPHFFEAVHTPLLLNGFVPEPEFVGIDFWYLFRELRGLFFVKDGLCLDTDRFGSSLFQLFLLSHDFYDVLSRHTRFHVLRP